MIRKVPSSSAKAWIAAEAALKAAASESASSRFCSRMDCSRVTPPSSISTAKDAKNSCEAISRPPQIQSVRFPAGETACFIWANN